MDREFAVILNSLTTEGQEKLINTVADFIQATDVIDGLYKEAKTKKMKKNDKRNIAAGAALATGGAGLTGKQYHRGNLTGRETLFHNTKRENVESIKEHGIKGSHASDPKNITNSVLGGKVPEKDIANKVYMARKRMVAEQVGMKGSQLSPGPRKTIKAKVPTWKMKEVDNPELRGAKNFREFTDAIHKENPHIPKPIIKAQTFGAVGALGRKGTATLEGDVGAKYIKGSKHFSRLGKEELKQFIKANPKRFAKGAGKAAIGLGAIGAGAHLIRKGFMKKKASEEEYKNPIPKASVRYAGGFIAGSALTPWITALLDMLGKNSKVNPAVNNLIQQVLPAITNPNTLGLVASVPGAFRDIQHNTRLKNEDRRKLHDLSDKNASSFIDALYKQAKMEVPTPQEAEKEKSPKKLKDDRPNIECENCNFEGKTTPRGECPRCGAIMGVKPSDYPIPYTPIWTGEPMSGISVNEASIRGRMEEAW